MDTRQMRCVVATAESGSLTRAAERLGLAQPALTQTLNRFEADIGTRLFERNRRGATLTEAGQAILDDLRASLAYGDAATERARAIGAGHAGRLTIGFVTHAVYEVLPRALQHEGVRFAVVLEVALPLFKLSALWRMRSRPGFADLFAAMLTTPARAKA